MWSSFVSSVSGMDTAGQRRTHDVKGSLTYKFSMAQVEGSHVDMELDWCCRVSNLECMTFSVNCII